MKGAAQAAPFFSSFTTFVGRIVIVILKGRF
jgi:hypothetical protein